MRLSQTLFLLLIALAGFAPAAVRSSVPTTLPAVYALLPGSSPASAAGGPASQSAGRQTTAGDPPAPAAPAAPAPGSTPAAATGTTDGPGSRPAWTPAGIETDVQTVLDGFVRTLATGDAQAARRLYTGLRGEEPWWRFVSSKAASGLSVAYFPLNSPPVIADESTVQADFEVTFGYREGAESLQQWYLLRALLSLDGSRWRIVEIRYF